MELQKFIAKNKLQLRPPSELTEKYANLKDDFFGFQKEVLIGFLDFEGAKPYLKLEFVAEVENGTDQWPAPDNLEEAAQKFLDYMKFAWGKAEDERGISASRSVQKLGMWLWIMGRDDLRRTIEDDELYNPYGAPALIAVCDEMGIEVPDSLREFAKVKCHD